MKKTKLAKKLKGVKIRRKAKPKEPLWQGPSADGPNGGVTQSMLSTFLVCRERFRIKYVEGLRPTDTFNHRIEYGNMWHVCEEEWAKQNGEIMALVYVKLNEYGVGLCRRYPLQQEQIQHWYNVCKTQFPIYVDYWSKHKDTKQRTPLLQEQIFDVSYRLPSDRVVRLRGKWDGVDLIGKGRNAGIYLLENKTKGDIKEEQLKQQLSFDLQTSLYLIALREYCGEGVDLGGCGPTLPQHINGVRYNVVRRPLSGGKGSIRQHKPTKTKPSGESSDEFHARLGGIIAEDPGHYFMRWKVEVTPRDLERFKQEFLNPILEQLYTWWQYVSGCIELNTDVFDPAKNSETSKYWSQYTHWRTPYGFYNILAEGGSSDLDEYLATGSELGLERTDRLFKELD